MPRRRKFPKTALTQFARDIRNGRKPVLLAEGDSWFKYPFSTNVIEHLEKTEDYAILNLAQNGDEAVRMLDSKEDDDLEKYLRKYEIDALLFSGGGNDIVNKRMNRYLKKVRDPSDWERCLHKTKFREKMATIKYAYEELIALRDEVRPECIIMTHGYDFPYPSDRGARLFDAVEVSGPWIKPRMDEAGLTSARAQRRLAKEMLLQLNEMLRKLASKHDRFVYLKATGLLRKEDWLDEMHPTSEGFGKVAAKFRRELASRFS